MKIFSADGKLISKKKYGEKKEAVTQREIEEISKPFLEDPKNKDVKNLLSFEKYKPFYEEVIKDSEGNILILKKSDDDTGQFDIFSPEGKFLLNTELPLKYFNHRNIVSDSFVYSIERNEEELRVIRKYKIIYN